jgi:predicted lipid-binding transport protein (Tim44 family)
MWYFKSQGSIVGPVSGSELAEKISDGSLDRKTLISDHGTDEGEWRPADSVREFASKVPPPVATPKKGLNLQSEFEGAMGCLTAVFVIIFGLAAIGSAMMGEIGLLIAGIWIICLLLTFSSFQLWKIARRIK